MRYVIALAALGVALAAAGTASAGGWATVGMTPMPDGTDAGGTWKPEITILQHGQTPLAGLTPMVTISDQDGGIHQFTATPTGQAGVYEASVVFPDAGDWSVVIDSGFGDSRLTYGPVTIDDGAPAGGDGRSLPTTGIVVFTVLLALLAAATLGVRRLRRLTPASR